MKWLCCAFLVIAGVREVRSQTLGGSAIYPFLKSSPSTQLTALGGVNASAITNDASLGFQNPSLLREGMSNQFSSNFSLFFAGVKNLHAQAVFYHQPSATTFSTGVQYVHYGSVDQTDASGNVMGSFRPYDYAVQVSAARKYLESWYYGVTFKFIQSNYGMYRSSAVALDIGINYLDSASGFQGGFLARNMGTQLHTYSGAGEDLPFDLQLGISKRFKGSPFQLSVTAHRLHQFNLAYQDTIFNADNGVPKWNSGFMANLFRHFVFAGQAYIGKRLEFTLAYNVLRRSELKVPNTTGGLSGISFGMGLVLPNWQFRFARSQFVNSTSYHQIGIAVKW